MGDSEIEDNSEAEERVIEENCNYIRKFIGAIRKTGLKDMSPKSKADIEDIKNMINNLNFENKKSNDCLEEIDARRKYYRKSDSNNVDREKSDEWDSLEQGCKKKTNLRHKLIKQTKQTKKPIIENNVITSSDFSHGSSQDSSQDSDSSESSNDEIIAQSIPLSKRKIVRKRKHDHFDNRKIPQMDKFDEKGNESLNEYLHRFERYCMDNIKGDSTYWISELKELIEGETLKVFDSIYDKKDTYKNLKKKLMEYDDNMKSIRKKKLRDNFSKMKMKTDESLYLFSARLEGSFKHAYPKRDPQSSKILRSKYLDSIPRTFKKMLKSQELACKVNDKKLTWKKIQKYARYKDVEDDDKKSDHSEEDTNEIVINVELEKEKVTKNVQNYSHRDTRRNYNSDNNMKGKQYPVNQYNYLPPRRNEGNDSENEKKVLHYNMQNQSKYPKEIIICNFCHRIGHTEDKCRRKMICYLCGKQGHMKKDCWYRNSTYNHKKNDEYQNYQRRNYFNQYRQYPDNNFQDETYSGSNTNQNNYRNEYYPNEYKQNRVQNERTESASKNLGNQSA